MMELGKECAENACRSRCAVVRSIWRGLKMMIHLCCRNNGIAGQPKSSVKPRRFSLISNEVTLHTIYPIAI